MPTRRKSYLILAGIFFTAMAAVTLITERPSAAAEKLNPEEVQKIVKDYLTEHPEVVIEAIEAYQANQQEIEARQFKETMAQRQDKIYDKSLPFAGNPDGSLVIAEFFDYNCGYCKRAINEVNKVLENYDDVKIVFHEFPILSDSSHDAARYALAAHKQGKYFAYHQALMTSSGSKSSDALEKIGSDLGLDVEQLRKDANSKEVRAMIEESITLARDLGIRGTPAFVIGDTLAPGYLTYQNMQSMIEDARDS